ncbi:FAD-binding oxidoreductase [Kangiella koreensis]|uniref:FAD linked oxidase domain protein n=1 Tax=Kangiella koreensis (strain DSM 16069 / JCM 12317 / KCTC 12182 / SW-125) TaxID=523791 RepID=C7RC96_KANKD|nr:FAD-binding oxidoreductase [Kangiella koreensis]ACV26888.1 FAD linked oxidase domain protein [Kangiella koreensis DSM 16069]
MSSDTYIAQLRTLLDDDCLLTDKDSLDHYGKDWTNIKQPAPLAIALPKTTEQVQALILWANDNQIAIVPSGGRTGLSGGAVAANGELVVALDKMNKVIEFNPGSQQVKCQAGAITEQIQQFAEDNDLYYPVDFASSGSSQIGGNIATNAGGIKVIRYGLTRDWVQGLTVVTGKGDILELNKGLVKNATGYDLRHLFIGSEGTLGIVTEATLKLTRKPVNLTVLLLAIPNLDSLMPILQQFQKAVDLTAFEFFSDEALEKVMAHHNLACPVQQRAPYYCLLEFDAASEDILEAALAEFETGLGNEQILDGTMSQSQQQVEDLWKYREFISETISGRKPYKNDISVTPEKITKFLTGVNDIVAKDYPDFEVIWFGHIGDGNLHLNILAPEDMDYQEFTESCEQVNPKIFTLLQELGGSISAEHGVGLLKKPYLNFTRSDTEISYLKAIKHAFDPKGIMNPGKVID